MFQFPGLARGKAGEVGSKAIGRVRKVRSVLVGQQSGNGGISRPGSSETAAATTRRGKARFLPSFTALKDLVGGACADRGAWEAKVVAGLQAVLDFAASNPEGAYALTVEARRRESGETDLEQEVLVYFAGLLRDVAGVERRFAISTEEAIVESIATMIRGHLQMGDVERLPERAPDLVYLTLMPYLGLVEASRWAASLCSEDRCGT
jgi:hypothetical protein